MTTSRPRFNSTTALALVIGCALIIIIVRGSQLSPLVALGGLGAVVLIIAAMAAPTYAVGFWLAAILFIPSWTTVFVAGVTVSPAFLNIPIAVGLTLRAAHEAVHRSSTRWHLLDFSVPVGAALVLVAQSVFGQQTFLATNVVIALLGAYVVGRFARQSLGRVFVVIASLLAVWGVIEFVTGWHAFVSWFTSVGGFGPPIQERGGLARSEASLGHAIAYGATLVAAMPFTRSFHRPLLLQLVLLAGVLTSLSRGPILAAVLTFALMLYAERKSEIRLRSVILLVGGLAVALFLFSALYNGSGQAELQSSSSARDDQLLQTLGQTNLFGPATGTEWDPVHSRYETNGVFIVDSTYLRFAIDFGWIITTLMLAPAIVAAQRVVARKAGSATIAVVGQIPILVVTSMITQWQVVFFMLVGMAVAEISRRKHPVANPGESDEHAIADIRLTREPSK
jgi:hypothetical protein